MTQPMRRKSIVEIIQAVVRRKSSVASTRLVYDVPRDDTEATRLEEFKASTNDLKIPPELDIDDYFYLRWLRARELDLTKARAMLEAYLEWRKNLNPSLSSDWVPPQLIIDEMPQGISGLDNEGRPVICFIGGRVNYKLIFGISLKNDLTHYIFKFLDNVRRAEDRCRKANGGITQTVLIADLEGLTLRKAMDTQLVQLAISCAKVLEGSYPELLHRYYMVNATWTFTMFFNLVKPFLSPVTLDKIQIFGNDPKQWKPVLLSNIPENSLPEEFGGTAGSISNLHM